MIIEPIDPPMEAPPARVGRYEVLAPLGHGGMASVHLVRAMGDAGFERLAAMKLLHRGLCADQEFVEMFLDEARVAARLHHPNTAAIHDLGSTGQRPFMVMDYVEGDTLHAVQSAASSLRRAVPLGIALRVALDVLAGLDAAHELTGPDGAPLYLIHRDVSPHNVLVGVDGVARLVDFGIARATSRRGVTAVGVVKGNIPFMAPEQLRGLDVDRRADLFSLGVTLWETLALRRCFPTREGAPSSRYAREEYRPLREFAPKLPLALDAVLRRALAFDPALRFPTAAAFAAELESAFRHDVATQRELGQFMSVVAADKVRREREAVRRSAQPMPDRAPAALPAAAGRRGRFVPVALPPSAAFFDPEAPTHAGRSWQSWVLPQLPARVATWRFGAARPARPAAPLSDALPGSLFEAVTEALARRRHAALAVRPRPLPLSEWVTTKMRAVAAWPDPLSAMTTLRLARSAGGPMAVGGLDGPTVPRRALPARTLPRLQPPPAPAGWLASLADSAARWWARLAL